MQIWQTVKAKGAALVDRVLDVVWERIVRAPFRAVLIAIAVGFLAGAIAVGSVRGYARQAIAVPGVAPFAALTESLPQSAVHWYVASDGRGACSAVTIAFEKMLTAAHCLDAGLDLVVTKDGIVHTVYGGKRSQNHDVAIIYVRGVYCPCAPVTLTEPVVGEPVMVIGFPRGEWMPEQPGKVIAVASIMDRLILLFGPPPEDLDESQLPLYYVRSEYLIHSAELIGGHSGGGTFVMPDGEWKLIAMNSYRFGSFFGHLESGSSLLSRSDLFRR